MNITLTEIQLFNLLKKKIGEEEADQLVSFVKADVKHELEQKTKHLATKEDLARVETKMILWAFVFWSTQLAVMFAFFKFFIDK